jgi:hypothetical protein
MSELEAMAGIENTTTTMMAIIVTIITAIIMAITTTIRGVEDITGVETTIRAGRMIPIGAGRMILIGAGRMIGIDHASIDCKVHSGDLGKLFGLYYKRKKHADQGGSRFGDDSHRQKSSGVTAERRSSLVCDINL